MEGSVLVGLLEIVAIAVAPLMAVSVLVRANLIYELCTTLGRRAYLFHSPQEEPAGPPLERLAAELRRLRPEARAPRPDVPDSQLRRSLAAYDLALLGTARALDVPTTLGTIPDGFEREVERRRLERALTAAGLSWQQHQD